MWVWGGWVFVCVRKHKYSRPKATIHDTVNITHFLFGSEACLLLTTLDGYFNWSHCKCYCTDCYDPHTQPRTKCKGQPPEEYVIPTGWAKFAVWYVSHS